LKWHHSTDDTRLRVIWRWILSWPWNLVYRSLKKLVPFESLGAVSYSPYNNYAVSVGCSRLWDSQRQKRYDLEIWKQR